LVIGERSFKMCDPLLVAGIGRALEHAFPSSDDFCVVREITGGGPFDMTGYERSNVVGPNNQFKLFNHTEVHNRYDDDPGGFTNSQKVRDGSDSQSDRDKDCRDEDRDRERDRYNDNNRNIRERGRYNEKEGTRDTELDRDRESDINGERGYNRVR
jgi:hypothetical protein